MEGQYAASWKPEIHFSDLNSEGVLRLREVENALLSLCFSGCQVSAATYQRLEKYVSGELSWQEASADLYSMELVEREAQRWAQLAATAKTDTQLPG